MEELEGIVQRMIDAGESEDAIAKVVQHYNDKLGKTSDPASVEATAGSENNMASSSETGLSESQGRPESTWQSIQNSWDNMVEQFDDVREFWGDEDGKDAAKDIATNAIYSTIYGQENLKNKDAWLGGDMGSVNTLEALDRYQKDQQEMKATKGIVDSWKKGDIGGVLAGGFNAITNMIGSVAYGAGTAGMGYMADFTARNYLEYNKQKAENLGISMSELVTSGQADNLAPVGFGALSMLSEGISTAASVALTVGPGKTIGKFVPKSVLNKVLYSKKRRAALAALISGSGEMVTEMTQHAVDEINDEMGRVAGTDEKAKILETYYEAMTSEEGLEAGLQGFVGGAGMTTGGYVAREVSNVRSVVDGDNLEKNLSELASLRLKLGQSNDDVVRNGIEAKINDIEMKIADSVIKGNKIYQNLDDGQLNQINGFSDLADATAFKITELNKKLRRNEISEQDYTLAKEGLEAEYNAAKQGIADMKLEENIDFLKSTVKDKKSAKNLKTTILNSTIETEQAMDNLSEVDKKGKQEFRDNKGNIAGFTVGGKIFVNKEVARKTGQINVAKHEFLHKVMNAKVGSAAEQGKIVKQLRRAMSRDQRKIVDAEMRSRGYRTQGEFDTEYVNVFSDLIAQEKISFEKSAMGKAGDAIIRFFKGEGFDNISFKDGRGVYNFLKDYSKNNELSAEAEAAIGDVDLAQEGNLQMSKIDYGAIEQRKGELDGTRDKSMIVAYDENFFKETMRRLRNVKLDDNVKEDIARSFILDDKRGLTKLLMDYDANRNDSVMGYLNGFVPQTKRSLFDARLQEFYESDPRYKNIIQSTTDENVARTVERKKAKSTPDKKDLGPVARKLSSFTNVDRNKNEKFYNKEVEQKAKDLISREIKLGVKNGLNASQIANNIKSIVETDVRDLIRSEMGAISRKKGEIVIPNSFRSLLEFGYEQILKSYPLARVKKMPGLFKKEKIGFTDKVTKKENKPELKKDSYYRKDDFKIYKPTKTELIKFFTEGGYTTLVEKQKRFAVDMSGDFAKVEVDKILNNQEMLESIVEIADGNENIVGVIQAEKLIQDISDYLDTKSEEKYGGDVVQFSKTAHSISRENASLIPNIKNLITDNKGIFVRNYLNKVPNYIEKTVKDILRAEQDNLSIDRSQADKIAKEIGSKWRVKNFEAKVKKYNVEQATDFLLENIKYNLDQSVGFEAINAKLGFKNLQDLKSLDSINNARLAVKYLFDNLEFRDFVRFIMPAVTNPARLAGFEVKKAIKGFFVKPSEVKLNKKSARDVIFANQADIKNALNIKENTRGMFRDDNTFKHKKWYNNEKSDFNNLDNDGQIAFAKDLYGKSQQEKKFMLKVIDLIKKAYDNKNLSLEQVQWLMRVLFAHQFSPGKVMAGVRYLPADVNGNILTRKQLHEQGLAYKNDAMVLEHMIPANYIRDAAYMYILTGDKNLLNQEIKNYDVAILPKLQDDKLRTTGVQSKMGINHKPGVNPLETRYDGTGLYFVDVTNGKVVGGPIQFSKSEVYQQDMSNKADRARLGPRKGLSVFDFDDTLAQTNSQVIVKMHDGKQFKINATEFALQSADLEAAGAVFDFSEFNKVIDGKKGPLFELAMKRQSKFGNQNIFVLTARPQESAYAIHAFLKGIGLEIPIDNITGLEDGRAEAKAEWIKEKAAQGYNDFYFADDAYKNVKAVQDMLSGLGLEPNVEQAKVQFSKSKTYGKPQFSKTLDQEFNDILEETKGVDSRTNVSKAAAKAKGESIKSTWFIPPGAEDFVGLIYQFLGKGVIGERQLKFFDEKLFKPFAKATAEMNRAKQAYVNGYQQIKKAFPGIRKRLNDRLSNGFMMQDAVRVYIWNKLGYDIPGLSQGEVQSMVRFVEKYSDITAYANSLAALTQDQGYIQPSENWVAGSIVSDINDLTTKTRRKAFLQEWIQNRNEIFSEKNMNKIESIYGSDFRSALEDMLWRMENGTNRKFGNNKLVNSFTNWVNNSVGAIMFFNMRSAVLQTISMFNFVNWSDNNPLKAGAAVANFDQYIKDFTFIFNSDMLKQRRSGLTTDINEAEIAAAVRGKGNTPQALLRYLLTKGFMPTQMADSFAIASGGATFYRNRINTYLQQGMSQTEAQKQAFEDFAEISEKTQQSARPDLISQQQAGPLGRLILAFQNTPMQYTRLMKKAYLDLINGRGDAKTNISKIAYYGFLQNLLFTTLQSALFALMFEDDEDEKEEMLGKKGPRILNNMADTILRGTGIYGAGVSTVKNIILKFREQEAKGFRADHTYTVIEFMNLSPPIGSKARRLYSGIQTYKFNKDIIPEYGFGLGNPIYQSIGNVVAAATNVPLDRLFNKINNVRASLNRENETWQRIANFLGWNTWDVGSEYDPELKKLKEKVKKQKKKDRKRSNSRNQKARDAAYERYRKNK